MARPRLAQPRKRKDYRFSPVTLCLIEQGQQLTETTKTAFIEAAIHHYLDFLTAKEEASEQEQQPVPIVFPAPSPAPAPTPSSRLPLYQIYVRHEPGTCPDLPEGFDYIDGDRSSGKRRCMNPIHRVYAQPCTIKSAEQRADALEKTAGIVSVWIEDKTGQHSWRKESGHWRRQ